MKPTGLALALVVALTAGCGGGDAAPVEPAAPPTEDTTTAPTGPDPDPPIVVEMPTPGERVSSPFDVRGTANVYEANVIWRLLDEGGKEIVRGFTTATCGTGCRGDFSTRIAFRVTTRQDGTLVVSDEDADGDGKPQHEVRVPLVLEP